jgi:hypothetical protein
MDRGDWGCRRQGDDTREIGRCPHNGKLGGRLRKSLATTKRQRAGRDGRLKSARSRLALAPPNACNAPSGSLRALAGSGYAICLARRRPGGFSGRRKDAAKILIADDDRDTADTLADLLRLSGYEVHIVSDGRQAIEAAGTDLPGLALLDLDMPLLVARKMGFDHHLPKGIGGEVLCALIEALVTTEGLSSGAAKVAP